MQTNKDKTTKVNLQGKLRLKRNNSDSSQNILNLNTKSSSSNGNTDNQNSCSSKQSLKENITKSPNAEDTLADFKSPKSEIASRPIFNKFKIDNDRANKKILKSKSKSRKSTSDIKQPSIESSFFKPQTSDNSDIKESRPCPLCLRPFKDDISCTNHMKTCAAKNKVSVKQLLDAKKLQDRQAEERKAMGLLATPVLPEKKKGFRSKKYSTEDDPQLQLVLAMSESLYQAEQMVQLEQAALLAGIPTECIKDMNEEERKTTLRNFGFTTNKPVTEISTNKAKKKKLLGPTVLQTRSKEDKDRVLTERIACILTGDDALTQDQHKSEIIRDDKPISLRSKTLKNIEKSTDKLWDKTRLTKKHNDFYVKELKSHFLPLDQQVEGAQSSSSKILTNQNDDDDTNNWSNISIEYEPMEVDTSISIEMEKSTSNLSNTSGSDNMNRELEFLKNLTSKWRSALNDSAASDLIIFVKNDKHIYVHKLVFHIQCSNILLHIEPNNSETQSRIKEKISWVEYEELSALAFLEFIYCGTIHQSNKIFENDDLLSDVNKLARLYKVPGLFTYLRSKQKDLKSKKKKLSKNLCDIPIPENNKGHANIDCSSNTISVQNRDTSTIMKNLSLQLQVPQIDDSMVKYDSDPLPFSKNDASLKKHSDRQITSSPDLFDSDEEEAKLDSCKTQENNQITESANNTNLKILIDLIDIDEKENSNDATSNDEDKDVQNISSQKTVVNLSGIASPNSDISIPYSPITDIHGTITPKERRSPEPYSPSRDIHDTITPKDRSPEIYNDVVPERMTCDNEEINQVETPKTGQSPERCNDVILEKNYYNEEIAEAVTPKARRSPELDCNFTLKIKDFKMNDISKAKTLETNNSASLNNHVTPKKSENADTDIDKFALSISSPENESMYTAVTPPRTTKNDCEPQFEFNGENIKKLKTDLSLFIDKVRRVNAKSALDTDSETDTPELRVTRKNPFLKQNRDDSYAYLKNDGRKNSNQRRVISLLEEAVLNGENKFVLHSKTKDSVSSNTLENTESHDLSTSKFPDINSSLDSQDKRSVDDTINNAVDSLNTSKDKSYSFEMPDKANSKNQARKDEKSSSSISDAEIHDVTVNENEMSMYSRYKKQNKNDNSIAKYRKELNFKSLKKNISNDNDTEFNRKSNLNNSMKESENTVKKNPIVKSDAKIEDITLVSDSDDEEHYKSLEIRELSNHNNLSSKSSNKCKPSAALILKHILAAMEDDTDFPLDLVDDNQEQFRASKVVSSTVIEETKSKDNVIDLSMDSDEEDKNDNSTFSYQLAVTLKNKKFNEKEFVKKDTDDKLLEISKKKTVDIDGKISKKLQNNSDCSNQRENLSKKSKKKTNQEQLNETTPDKNAGDQRKEINSSPISIASSPEMCELDKEKLSESDVHSSNKAKNKNFNTSNTLKKTKLDELNTIDNEFFNDLDFDNEWNIKTSLEKSVEVKSPSSNISRSNLGLEKSPVKQTSQISPLISSPILTQDKQTTRERISKKTSIKRKSQSPEQRSKQTRKLKIESSSASNVSVSTTNNKKYDLQKSSSAVVLERNQNPLQRVVKFARAVTPPPDYSTMDTLELNKELRKYGLRPQPRKRAIALLMLVYNETHPNYVAQKRTTSSNLSDSDEAPPSKKQNLKKTGKKNIFKEKVDSNAAQSSRNPHNTAEQMDYDEASASTSLDNPVSIKDVFNRLLKTNKDLYTKVLKYEPLPLEPLHLMLKQNGFKCELNLLIEFLDEQCITFQYQNAKGNRTKKKQRKK